MRLKAWIVDAPAGGSVMQILEQEGVKPELLTGRVRIQIMPELATYQDELFLQGTEHCAKLTIVRSNTRTAQSVIDQLTAGLAGHAVSREPKRGDWVEVMNECKGTIENRIFICKIQGASLPYICVTQMAEQRFIKGEEFTTCPWKYMDTIPQPVRYSRSGDVHTWTTEAEKAGEGK